MSDWQINSRSSNSAKPASSKLGAAFLILFATPFAAFGIFALVQAFQKWDGSKLKDTVGLGLFGLIFSGVGFGLMVLAIVGLKKSKQSEALKAQHPDSPWLLRPDWAAGEIKSSAAGGVGVLLFMGLMFLGIGSVSTVIAVPRAFHGADKLPLLVLFFPLAGIVMLSAAAYMTMRRRKYGAVIFKMASVPAPLGGVLSGVVRVPEHFSPQGGVRLRLSCIHRYVTGTGKQRRTVEEVLWDAEKILGENLPRGGAGCNVPVFFKIPADAREADERDPNDRILWRLTATAQQPGIDFRADFEVPVFRTAASATPMADIPDPLAQYEVPDEQMVALEDPRIKATDLLGGGREFYFPAARNVGNAIGLTFFWLVWTGFLLLFGLLDGRHGSGLPHLDGGALFFVVVFGLVDVLIIFALINCWFKRVRVTITRDTVTIARHWLLFGYSKVVPCGDVADFSVTTGMQSGSTVYRTIRLQGRDGSLITTVITMIRSPREADWLAQQMKRAAKGSL